MWNQACSPNILLSSSISQCPFLPFSQSSLNSLSLRGVFLFPGSLLHVKVIKLIRTPLHNIFKLIWTHLDDKLKLIRIQLYDKLKVIRTQLDNKLKLIRSQLDIKLKLIQTQLYG